jgi:S-adenosylmethionine decarboxylase
MFQTLSGQLGDRVLAPVGSHCILELYDCAGTLLNDVSYVLESLREAVRRANATLLSETYHQFEPHGITALFLLSESHISIHTWPEVGYAAVDAFTCGSHTDPEKACLYLVEAFQAGRHNISMLRRNPPPTVISLSPTTPMSTVDELVGV